MTHVLIATDDAFAPTQQIQTRISNAVNKMPTYPDDIVLAKRLVDEWGRGFVAEADYRLEAENTEGFREARAVRAV